MKSFACALGIVLVAASSVAADDNAPVKDANVAIEKARHVCALKQPPTEGQWQAVLVKDSWHVWFGVNQVEPVCSFDGAYVRTDGSYTGCVISVCEKHR